MSGPVLDNRISAGNILVAAGMLVSVAVAWGSIRWQTNAMASEISSHAATAAAHEARIRVIETTTARQDERLSMILTSLQKIEGKVDLISEREKSRP